MADPVVTTSDGTCCCPEFPACGYCINCCTGSGVYGSDATCYLASDLYVTLGAGFGCLTGMSLLVVCQVAGGASDRWDTVGAGTVTRTLGDYPDGPGPFDVTGYLTSVCGCELIVWASFVCAGTVDGHSVGGITIGVGDPATGFYTTFSAISLVNPTDYYLFDCATQTASGNLYEDAIFGGGIDRCYTGTDPDTGDPTCVADSCFCTWACGAGLVYTDPITLFPYFYVSATVAP